MGAKEDFSSSLKLETSESIRIDLSETKNPASLYKKSVEVLGKMEKNFDVALGGNPYDYFDGRVEVNVDKTEFEKKAKTLSTKARELNDKMSIGSALYVLAQSKLGISSVEQQELDSLVQELLQTQERAKKQVEDDLSDGRLDNESHIAPNFVEDKKTQKLSRIITLGDEVKTLTIHQVIPQNVDTATITLGDNNNYNGSIPKNTPLKIIRENGTFVFADQKYRKEGNSERVKIWSGDRLSNFESSKDNSEHMGIQLKKDDIEKYNKVVALFGNSLEIKTGNIHSESLRTHINNLSLLPEKLVKILVGKGVTFIIGDLTLTRMSNDIRYKFAPRGWKDTNNFDNVPGVYDNLFSIVYAGNDTLHGSSSMILHEIGHSMGDKLNLNNSDIVISAHKRLFNKLTTYLQQGGPGAIAGRQELLAESFADYFKKDRNSFIAEYDNDWYTFLSSVVDDPDSSKVPVLSGIYNNIYN